MSYTHRYRLALDRILELVVVLNDDMTRSLASYGLTVSRTHLLWELRQRGPTTQKALADALQVSPRTVTGLIDGLVSSGFVTREPHPSDRRATHVSFTEWGVSIMVVLERSHAEFAQALFASMPDTDFDCFVVGLDQLLGRLREHVAASGEDA